MIPDGVGLAGRDGWKHGGTDRWCLHKRRALAPTPHTGPQPDLSREAATGRGGEGAGAAGVGVTRSG